MPYRVQVVDGRVDPPGTAPTWQSRMELPFISGSWARKRNGGAGGQIVINTRAEQFKGVQRLPVWPWQSWVVIEWRASSAAAWHVVYAGVITDASYDWASKQLSLSHADIWQIFQRRLVTNDRTNDIATTSVSWSGLSAGTLVKRIVQNAMDGKGSPLVYALPIRYPTDVAGSKKLKVYGYNFEIAADLINDLIEDEDGPDIDFRPRWSQDNTLEWVLEVNANKSDIWDFDLDVEQGSVLSMVYKLDGSDLCTKMYGAGEGTERRTLVRQSDHNDTNYLAMEDVMKFSSVSELDQLQSMTTGARFLRDGAIRQLDMKIRADGSPRLNELSLGGSLRWKANNDPWLVSGWHEWEVIEFSGNLANEEITLVTQEMEGRAADQ